MKYIYRGIYIDRVVSGRFLALRLLGQDDYRKWAGCYSRIQWTAANREIEKHDQIRAAIISYSGY